MNDASPRVSVVVLSWNTCELLGACLESLSAVEEGIALEVIVVDNASDDGSADFVEKKFPSVHLIRNETNQGYAIGNNLGAQVARGEFLLLLNSDTEVRPSALTTLVAFMESHASHGACAPLLEHESGEVQRSCKRFPNRRTALFFDTIFERWFSGNQTIPRYFMEDFDHQSSRDVDQPPGAALMVRRTLWESLGGLDPDLWLFFNDVDLCRKIHEQGFKIGYVAEARVMHHEGASTAQFPEFGLMWHQNRLTYYRKTFGWWGGQLARCMSMVRGWEELRRLRRAGADPEEMKQLRQVMTDVWRA